jgi:hypothetical protein
MLAGLIGLQCRSPDGMLPDRPVFIFVTRSPAVTGSVPGNPFVTRHESVSYDRL